MHVAISSHLEYSNISSKCCVRHASHITHIVHLHSVTTGSFLSSTKHSHDIKPFSHSMSVLSAPWTVLLSCPSLKLELVLEATVILSDEARSIDSVLYMEPLFKVGDIMCLKEKQSQELGPF